MRMWKRKPLAKPDTTGIAITEVLIVLAIIGLLVAIALPAWQDFTTVSNRGDVKTAIWEIAKLQEKRYSKTGSYASTLGQGEGALEHPARAGQYYTIEIQGGGDSYTIVATAIGSQAENDTECATLTLTHWGVSSPERCWKE